MPGFGCAGRHLSTPTERAEFCSVTIALRNVTSMLVELLVLRSSATNYYHVSLQIRVWNRRCRTFNDTFRNIKERLWKCSDVRQHLTDKCTNSLWSCICNTLRTVEWYTGKYNKRDAVRKFPWHVINQLALFGRVRLTFLLEFTVALGLFYGPLWSLDKQLISSRATADDKHFPLNVIFVSRCRVVFQHKWPVASYYDIFQRTECKWIIANLTPHMPARSDHQRCINGIFRNWI